MAEGHYTNGSYNVMMVKWKGWCRATCEKRGGEGSGNGLRDVEAVRGRWRGGKRLPPTHPSPQHAAANSPVIETPAYLTLYEYYDRYYTHSESGNLIPPNNRERTMHDGEVGHVVQSPVYHIRCTCTLHGARGHVIGARITWPPSPRLEAGNNLRARQEAVRTIAATTPATDTATCIL
ncbi:hypothetical protein J6590_044252 [Homalodisca vitripennis]|nr:hypothetical protein J6590_044252 [Homalodisca vitripennis]